MNYLNSDNSCSASVMEEIKPLPSDPNYEANDWVLLKIENPRLRETTNSVTRIGKAAIGQKTRLTGYPDGSRSFEKYYDSFVTPTAPDESFQVSNLTKGLVELHGTDSRPGMSGGGVFSASNGHFLGLHRSRNDPTLKMHFISAKHIFDRLAESKYRLELFEDSGAVGDSDLVRDPFDLRNEAEATLNASGASVRFHRDGQIIADFDAPSSDFELQLGVGVDIDNSVDLGEDALISPRHAVLIFANGVWKIIDLDSEHGTYINGEDIRKMGWSNVSVGDEVIVGATCIEITTR